MIELDKIADYLNKPIEFFYGEEYLGDRVQILIVVIRKMPPDIREEQLAIIQSMFFMQELSDELVTNEDISDEDMVNSTKVALGNSNLQLAMLRSMWDKAQIAKSQLEEIIGINDTELE